MGAFCNRTNVIAVSSGPVKLLVMAFCATSLACLISSAEVYTFPLGEFATSIRGRKAETPAQM